jgi:hypothetical protein
MRRRAVDDYARIGLATIRLFNGGTALFAPGALAARTGVRSSADGPVLYPWRMFGIRTLLIGSDLLARDPEIRRHALRVAVLVHASDTASACAALRSGQVPRKTAVTATAISSLNTVLALLARRSLNG